MRTATIGAPSLTGKDANEVVKDAFQSAKFPLAVKVINHMPRQAVFPVAGVFLGHVCDVEKSSATVTISTYEQLQSLTTDVEQIAELNRYEKAITVEEVEKDTKPKAAGGKAAKTEAPPAPQPDATSTEGNTTQPQGSNTPPAE